MLSKDGEVHVTHRDDYPYNEWQIVELANNAGLKLKEKVLFDECVYSGYCSCNKRGGNKKSNGWRHKELVLAFFKRAVKMLNENG
ncbi:hypothetical protein Sjap_003895 [Stephania japonica]|uniref:25S rRNA (uridine-N(3))-methyltransferase BMT5-like domain-containing protein n=1 Tax=Stephania japonica TaxID=461633 RepID=A0AAP0PVG1_9MAGN